MPETSTEVIGLPVRLAGGTELTTRGVLVATGLRDELPEIPGVRERWGNDVLHCPYCHGYEVRDAPIGVLGGDNRPFTLHQASLIRQWSPDVVFFPNRITLDAEECERLTARGIRIVDGEVARLVVQDELLTSLGYQVGENGWVATDATGHTSVPGAWAAGDVVDSSAQAITAGSVAAIAINHYLLAEDVEQAVMDIASGADEVIRHST